MKKLLFIPVALFLLLPDAVQAQTYAVDRGNWIVGGSASLTSQGNDSDDDDERTTAVTINPRAQVFILPGLAVGGTAAFSYTSQDFFSTTSLGVGPTVSYYFGQGERTVYPFVSASVSLSELSFNADDVDFADDLDQSVTTTSFDVSGGVTLMVAKNVGLTGEVFYRQEHFETDDEDREIFFSTDLETNTFGLRFGIAAFVF